MGGCQGANRERERGGRIVRKWHRFTVSSELHEELRREDKEKKRNGRHRTFRASHRTQHRRRRHPNVFHHLGPHSGA